MLRTLLLGLLLLLSASCGGGDLQPPLRATTPNPGHVQQDVRAMLTLRVRGAETVDIKQQTKLHTVEILGGRTPVVTWFVSISAGEQIKLKDGRTVLFTADLAPGIYKGAGKYTLSDKSGVAVQDRKSPLGSAAYVQLLDIGPPPKVSRFDQFAEPCTLNVAEDVVSGNVDCPKLADEKGRTVSLQWSWERI